MGGIDGVEFKGKPPPTPASCCPPFPELHADAGLDVVTDEYHGGCATAIVVSGMYEDDHDADGGERLVYTGEVCACVLIETCGSCVSGEAYTAGGRVRHGRKPCALTHRVKITKGQYSKGPQFLVYFLGISLSVARVTPPPPPPHALPGGGGGTVGQAREGTSNKTGVGRTKDDGAVTVQRKPPCTMQARTPPASTMKRTRPATNKERALRTCDPWSGGAYVVDGRDNAWRSRAPGPHAHGKAARQVVDGLKTEVCGQQKQSNDPRNNQHNPSTPTTGRR